MKENWTYKKLGEVCESDLGKTLNSKTDTGEYYPYLCAVNILWDKIDLSTLKTTRFEFSELERYSVRKGDLLICEGGDIGRAAIWEEDEPIRYQNALHRIRFNGDMIPRFVLKYLHFLKNTGVLDNNYGKGVTIKHLVKSSLLSIPVPVPSLLEQQHIVSELDLLQSIIDKQQAQLKELDKLAQAVFYDMFGDPVQNEKGWEVKKLEEIMSIPSRNGLTKPTAIRGTGVPMISMGELFANPIIKDSIKATLVPVSKKEIELSQIIRGDLLFARQSLSLEGAGKCSFVESCLQPTVFESHIIRIRVDNCVTHPRYVFYYFLSPYGKSEIRKRVYQVAAAGIKGSELIKIPIPIPPLSLQQSFVEKIEAIEQQKARISQSIAETQRLFDYTMDKYFG